MGTIVDFVIRDDLRDFSGYSSARSLSVTGDIWLNANESAWNNTSDPEGICRRYCDPQPPVLREKLAALYGCPAEELLIGRGSDEMIDLLVRATCVPQRDTVIWTPPVFGMYAVSTRLQHALPLEIPLRDTAAGLEIDSEAIIEAALRTRAKLIFLCSPSNPGGKTIPLAQIQKLAHALEETLIVVDEAYIEFADSSSAITLMSSDNDNIAVLRTLSKAHALAAARIGCLIADARLIAMLRRCQAPYPVPAPCVNLALGALNDQALAQTQSRIEMVRRERQRLQTALLAHPLVRRVYDSDANFLLVRFDQAQNVFDTLLDAGIVVRDQRAAPQLTDALRITIGTPEQNDRVLELLFSMETTT